MTRTFTGFLISVFTAAALMPAVYAQEVKPRLAPLNPKFVKYLEARKSYGAQTALKTPSGHWLGRIPSPRIALTGSPSAAGLKSGVKSSYPVSYDLRDHSKVTSVKDQGSCGDCWAFGALSSLESYFSPGETLDLSEADLNANSGFDYGSCNGGNDYMSAAYMTRWSGPLFEISSDVAKHVQDIVFLTARASATDNDRIKDALRTYGALAVAFYYSDAYYNPTTHSYYANISATNYSSNHEVSIIGWDDNYAKENFFTTPAGNGAFLCKNSWGTSWGDSGYFYVSYYDGVFGRDDYVTAFTGEPVTNYTRVYSYDTLGWVGDFGYDTTTAWYANIFTAAASENISAVGFYTNDDATNYTAYVYTGVTAGQPASGMLAYSYSGSFDSPGFHTVPIGYRSVTAGQLFSVVIKVTNASYISPIPVEAQFTGYSSGASASGNSYISNDGSSWVVLTGLPNGTPTDVTLKAYVATRPPEGTVALKDNLFRPLKNPAVPCKITVTIFTGGDVTVKVYTMNGDLVRTIYSGPQSVGPIIYSWDGKNDNGKVMASGLYFVHVKGPSTDRTEKVVLIK